ncbi:MAG TPA: tRNA pseudouridine(55) synthase TruB [Chitinophagaceae bacterium]
MKQKPVHPALQTYLEGELILINKPLKWTSFDAVKKVRILTRVSKVGHAGTLDPLATGLLIICTGKFTKKINEYMGMEKEYMGTFTLGATTPTYDLESVPENFKTTAHLSVEVIHAATKQFTGNIMQLPPAHSAIKKEGRRLYELARKGEQVILEARAVIISSFEIINICLPVVEFKVVCSTGTYIRSLANDFGRTLGTGAYLSSLCRTRIGKFLLKDALTPDQFEEQIQQLRYGSKWHPDA